LAQHPVPRPPRRPGRPRRATPRPRLEGLEDRRLLNVSPVFDPAGNLSTGTLIEYTKTSATMISKNVYFATAYLDAGGHLGRAFGTIDASSNVLASAVGSAGTRLLYQGSSVITQAVGDYDEAVDAMGRVLIDVVFNPANAGAGTLGAPHTDLEFGPAGITDMGLNVNPL
jgi:hypothetical protein